MNTADMKMRMGSEAKASTNPSGKTADICPGSASTPNTNREPALVNSRNCVATAAIAANTA